MRDIRETLRKINSGEYESIDSDEEYFYAVGQLLRYYISLNKTTKNHSLLNPFLNLKSNKILKDRLALFFKNITIQYPKNL